MLELVPDHLKIKKMCKRAVKKLPYLLRYVPDKYKIEKCVINNSRKWWNIKVCF